MTLEELAPDLLERRIAGVAGRAGVLSPCPFCAHRPLLASAVGHVERHGRPLTLYQARIFCRPVCGAQMIAKGLGREEAQQAVIAKWERRVTRHNHS